MKHFYFITHKFYITVSSMNKTQKHVPQVKKVPPPAIPDSVACRHSGSSFGSTGYSSSSDDAFHDPNTFIKPGNMNTKYIFFKSYEYILIKFHINHNNINIE